MASKSHQSSGDLTADRRFAYAVDLLADGDALAAADLIEQALELAPTWPAGWFKLGEARAAAGDRPAALAAFERTISLQPDDALGASLHIARLTAGPTPGKPPPAFVRDLFDAYADRFDRALIEGLDYRVPQIIAAELERVVGSQRFGKALDLGCGTGLMATELRARVDWLVGVDLSAGMVAQARGKRMYDALEIGDIVDVMADMATGSMDLITAADVFCYLGDLNPPIAEASRIMRTGGLLVFSVEASSMLETDPGYTLGDSLRFRHTQKYLDDILVGNGLKITAFFTQNLRLDRGLPIAGFVVITQKP